jgi:hypothetical protein
VKQAKFSRTLLQRILLCSATPMQNSGSNRGMSLQIIDLRFRIVVERKILAEIGRRLLNCLGLHNQLDIN